MVRKTKCQGITEQREGEKRNTEFDSHVHSPSRAARCSVSAPLRSSLNVRCYPTTFYSAASLSDCNTRLYGDQSRSFEGIQAKRVSAGGCPPRCRVGYEPTHPACFTFKSFKQYKDTGHTARHRR